MSTPPKVELADLSPLLLKKERATASFDVPLLIDVIHGSRDQQARRKHLLDLVINDPVLCDRDMISRNHKERYEKALEKSHAYAKLLETHHITDPDEQTYVYYAIGEPLPIDVHRSMFIPTLQNQMDDEQQAIWVPKATSFQITGAYAQTELGHGSNVQGIETTAHYDKNTQEFVLNSPTLTSRKWWPGTKDVLVQQHGAFLLKCLHNRRAPPTTSTPGLNLLEFLHVDAHSKCAASHPSDVRRPDVLLRAFQVRALELLVRADAHSQSLHHLTQASVAHAELVVLSCFYAGVGDIKDGNLKLAMLQLWQLYGLWRLQANLGEFRLADHLSSTQGTWVQDQLLALLPLVRRNAVALVDGFGLSDFELNSTIGRYDGDIYRALVARAAAEPLNQTDVVPGYHQWLQPLLSAKL
ncbi:hypothetical protein DYB35_012594 [Aphanomyces astaci]|uniref:Acyl-coenzyme A oxidase N-terminal domain-containing protein n=1 Tax=Aphanomyces astaci TaxID=112090 RepID=A0A418DUH7_APHAT|nr:hypothetical protein DYB35_012594 [Aphanomyces astaci]